jgi:DNA-binding transcriptional MerR regulator
VEKQYYSITEVSEKTGIEASALRYYESRKLLRPSKTAKGTRQYTAKDIDTVIRINQLKKEGHNLAGVKKQLENNIDWEANRASVISRLQKVRQDLFALKMEFEVAGKG